MATIEELHEKKMRILAQWASWVTDAEAKGERPNMSKFVEVSKGTDWEANLSSMHNWVRRSKKTTATPKAYITPTSPSATIEGMEAEIKRQQEALDRQKADYIKVLDNEVARLRAELAKAEQKYEMYSGKKYPPIAQ